MTHLRGGCRDSAVNQPVVLAKGHAGLEPGVKMRMMMTTLLLLLLLLLLLTTPCRHRDTQNKFTRLSSGYGGQGYRLLPCSIIMTCAKMREKIRHLRFTHFLAFQIAPPHSQRDEVAAPRHAPHRNEKRERFADEND